MMSDTNQVLIWLAGGGIAVLALLGTWIGMRGRLLAGEHVFRASRWSRGNHLFPTQVAITPDSVVHHTPQWFGRREQSIHMAHVASVEVDTNLFFSNVVIETSGGSEPVRCHGHRKRDAVEMKRLINRFQSEYYGPNRQGTHV
jgi:hypothetical protein